MHEKIIRFYNTPGDGRSKKQIDHDFDTIEGLTKDLRKSVDTEEITLVNDTLEKKFESRLRIILYQNKFRAYYLLKGIVHEMNADNIPTVIPLVRTVLELTILMGYVYHQITTHDDLQYLLDGPLEKIMLGNKYKEDNPLRIGTIESTNILSMIPKADKAYKNIAGEDSKDNFIETLYGDLSNQSHPNYASNMLYSSITADGKFLTFKQMNGDMEELKKSEYEFYLTPLVITIGLYRLFWNHLESETTH